MPHWIYVLNTKLAPFHGVFWWCAGVCGYWLICRLIFGEWPQSPLI